MRVQETRSLAYDNNLHKYVVSCSGDWIVAVAAAAAVVVELPVAGEPAVAVAAADGEQQPTGK